MSFGTDKISTANFDLEQKLLQSWEIVDDIKEVASDLEHGKISVADAITILNTYHSMYSRRFQKAFERYEEVSGYLHDLRQNAVENSPTKNGENG